jgi:hypothetical protein
MQHQQRQQQQQVRWQSGHYKQGEVYGSVPLCLPLCCPLCVGYVGLVCKAHDVLNSKLVVSPMAVYAVPAGGAAVLLGEGVTADLHEAAALYTQPGLLPICLPVCMQVVVLCCLVRV